MTVQNARPCSFTQLTTDADWEMLVEAYGVISGVKGDVGSPSLAPVFNGSSRAIDIAAGAAIVQGRLWSCDAAVSTAIPAAGAQDRVDRLVLRLDRGAGSAAAVVQPVVITGTPSASPVAPSIQRSSGALYDIYIARWTSKAGGNLTGLIDERVFTSSPVVTGTSQATPSLTRPGLLIETDTGRLRMSRFAGSWDTVAYQPPDTWHSIPLKAGWTGSMKVTFPDPYRRFAHVSSGGLVPGNHDNGTIIGTMPADYRPKSRRQLDIGTDDLAQHGPLFVFEPNGQVTCWGIAPGATAISIDGDYPLDLS